MEDSIKTLPMFIGVNFLLVGVMLISLFPLCFYIDRKDRKLQVRSNLAWAIYPHRVQDIEGRGWGYVDEMLKKLRDRIKIKDVLKMLINAQMPEKPWKGNHLPGAYSRGRKTEKTPDYWEWGA